MSRNMMVIIIAILVVALAVVGYMYYQAQQTNRLEISVGEHSISVETN